MCSSKREGKTQGQTVPLSSSNPTRCRTCLHSIYLQSASIATPPPSCRMNMNTQQQAHNIARVECTCAPIIFLAATSRLPCPFPTNQMSKCSTINTTFPRQRNRRHQCVTHASFSCIASMNLNPATFCVYSRVSCNKVLGGPLV